MDEMGVSAYIRPTEPDGVDRWVHDITIRAPAPSAPPGWTTLLQQAQGLEVACTHYEAPQDEPRPAPAFAADTDRYKAGYGQVASARKPALQVGLCLAIVSIGCSFLAVDATAAAAQGGWVIAVLNFIATAMFSLMLISEPLRIRPRRLGVVAFLLGLSTGLEGLLSEFPWTEVQILLRAGCITVALAMVGFVIFSVNPKPSKKVFFYAGLLLGAGGSSLIALGSILAAQAILPFDGATAIGNLLLGMGCAGVGLKCFGLRVVPIGRGLPMNCDSQEGENSGSGESAPPAHVTSAPGGSPDNWLTRSLRSAGDLVDA